MKYKLLKRKTSINVKDSFELVTWLRKTDSDLWMSNEDYMQNFATKKRQEENLHIDSTNEERFVNSLIATGEVQPLERKNFWRLLLKSNTV